MQLTGAEIVIECLKEQGVDTVFGYPGGAILNVYDALYKHSDEIRHILTSHEQGASHAADGYSRVPRLRMPGRSNRSAAIDLILGVRREKNIIAVLNLSVFITFRETLSQSVIFCGCIIVFLSLLNKI